MGRLAPNGYDRGPHHAGLVTTLPNPKVVRTLPSDTQISTVFNYIGVDLFQNPLTEAVVDVALPPLEESFHRHHNQLLDLYVHTEHAEEQRLLSQQTFDLNAQ